VGRFEPNRGRRYAILALISATLAALAAGTLGVLSASGAPTPEPKVTLCHRTADTKMPYVEITVNSNAIANVILGQNGHATHTGPIFPDTGADGKWGDIIPAFNIPPNSFGGLNNTTQGLAILANGCEIPGPPPTTGPPTTAPPTSPTTAPPTTRPSAPTTRPSAPTTQLGVSPSAAAAAAARFFAASEAQRQALIAAGRAPAAAPVAGAPRTTG